MTNPWRWAAHTLTAGALLLASTSAIAENWRAERVTGTVTLEDGAPLADGAPIAEQARIQLDGDGALTLWRAGARLRLRGPADLQLFPAPKRGVARVQLREGAMRADGPAGRDLRINAGDLRLRLVNAEAWMAADADGDRVCALDRTTQVQLPNSVQTLMLQRTGACMRLLEDGTLLHERPTRSELNAWLSRADGGSDPVPVTFQPAPVPDSARTGRSSADEAAPTQEPETDTTTEPRATADPDQGGPAASRQQQWFVVIGAFTDDASARQVLSRDEAIGTEEAHVLRITGGELHRSAVGPFPDRASAERRRAQLRARYPDAWLLRPEAKR